MSAVSLLSSLREKPTDDSHKEASHHEGDEECGVPGGGGGDPAVLAMGPARRPLTYTRDELMRLRNSPLVKRGLENAFAGCEALALVLKRRSDSPNEEDRGARGDAPIENHKGVYGRERRSADPRERVRKESEPSSGIVLSPQRRSFTSGCGAPGAAAGAPVPQLARTRPDSPLSAAVPAIPAIPAPHPAHNPAQAAQLSAKPEQGGRRIGSGRIMVRDVNAGAAAAAAAAGWEEPAAPAHEYRADPYRPPQPQRDRDRDRDRDDRAHTHTHTHTHARTNGDRYERRSYGRDSYSSDIKRERDDRFNNDKPHREDNRRSGGRYSQRRFEKEDEPEWFSGGPTSQLETIELRGFDEPTKKNGTTNNKETDKWNNNGGSRSPAPERWRETNSPATNNAANDSANTNTNINTNTNTNNDKDSGMESKSDEAQSNNDQPEFNLDEFLKFDTIPDVLTNGGGESEGGSRFSRWFRRESPTNDARHYERLLNNIVDDLDNSIPGVPGEGQAGGMAQQQQQQQQQHVFAPISPASARAPPPSLLDLLRRANAEATPEVNSGGGKIHSLEELEARLRPAHAHAHALPAHAHPAAPPAHAHAHAPVPDHDLSAFKRLLAQVSGGHAVPAAAEPPQRHSHQHQHQHQHQPQPQQQPQPQPMSLLQMLNKSMEQQQHQQQQKQQQQQQQQQQPHIPQELLYKLLQVQQRQQQVQVQANSDMGHLPSVDRDLLQRPEAQAIVHGLKAGEITVQHVMQQLGNPGLQSRHREVLLAILRLHQQQRQMGGSPLPGGVGVAGGSVAGAGGVAAPHLVVPHHQPLRLSPLPHQGVPARIPSPRELAAHTQSIMQGALIKKKLEEQRENYRRRHEMQHQPKQPTPISFTPTSVLRKMTADKECDAPSPKQQQWTQPPKMPQGRPIVKGNQSGAAPPIGYNASSPSDYQLYLSQQQQMAGSRPFPHSQQSRQQVPNSFNNMNMTRGISGGTTLHQLLVQSHQRSLNEQLAEMGGSGPGTGGAGGDNQLARWFSPELLARASAGKLPSVHVPNALSLEDLERHHHSPAPPLRN